MPAKKRKAKPAEAAPPPIQHEPTPQTRRQVEMLCAYGIKHDDIAALIGVSDVTLRKYYREELDLGTAKITAQVANSLIKKALSDDPSIVNASVNAGKYFLDRRAPGWSEKHKHEITPTMPDGSTPGQGMRFTLEFVDPVTNGAGDKAPGR